jgi:hypothetical protein
MIYWHRPLSGTLHRAVTTHLTEDIAVPDAFVTGAREGRVIGQLVLDAQSAKLSLGQIDLHLPAKCPFRSEGNICDR